MLIIHILWPFFLFYLIICIFEYKNNRNTIGNKISRVVVDLMAIQLILILFFGQDISHATKMSKLGKVQIANQPLKLKNTEHLVIVPFEIAKKIGEKTLSSLEHRSFFTINHFELQLFRKTLYWVAPIEFKSPGDWISSKHCSPGYVMVNAEDPEINPKIIQGYKLRYTFGASPWNNPQGYLYFHGYSTKEINSPIFEIDDQGKPFYVIPIGQPTAFFSGQKLLGAVILDPENGQNRFYPLGKTPSWVDRVIPEDLAEKYASWWGLYTDGWINAHSADPTKRTQEIDQKDSDIDDSDSANMMLIDNGDRLFWLAGMIYPGESIVDVDNKYATGLITVDSVTGKIIYYPRGDYCCQREAIIAVKDNRWIDPNEIYQNCQPTFASLEGDLFWIIPLMLKGDIKVSKIAIVRATDYEMASGRNFKAALAQYHALTQSQFKSGEIVKESSQKQSNFIITSGKVIRLNQVVEDGQTVFYLVIDINKEKIFKVTKDDGEEILVTQKNDLVKLSSPVDQTSNKVIDVNTFDNLGITN
jgi:hypothetical protein